jgi:hypothetical protein
MHLKLLKLILNVQFIIFLLLLSCVNNPSNTVNETNTIVGRSIKGRFLDINGKPIVGATVRVYSASYVPSFSLSKKLATITGTTDLNGAYQIPFKDSGLINIDGFKDSLGTFIDSIKIPKDSVDVIIPDKVMKKVGVIKGVSYMPGQNDTNQVRVTLYIPGTGRITKPIIGGKFTFENVPEGRYQIIIDPTLNAYNVKVVDTTLIAGDTINFDTITLKVYEPDTIDILTPSVYGHWGPNKKYRINMTSEIPPGRFLIIDSGSTVIMNGSFFLQAGEGSKLIVNGTQNFPVKIVHGISNFKAGGIAVAGGSCSLTNCNFSNLQSGINFFYSDSAGLVTNCIFKDCELGIDITSSINKKVKIVNNIFMNNHKAIYYHNHDDSLFSTEISNNIFINNNAAILFSLIDPNKTKVNLKYNCFNKNDTLIVDQNWSPHDVFILPLDSIVTADPLFVNINPGNEDFHLNIGSPCIGSGKNKSDMGVYSTYKP